MRVLRLVPPFIMQTHHGVAVGGGPRWGCDLHGKHSLPVVMPNVSLISSPGRTHSHLSR